MHFTQIIPCILVSATAAVAQLIPVGPIATLYNQANYLGDYFNVGKVGQCVEIPDYLIGNVSSIKLQQFSVPFFVACSLYSNDYCKDPAASVIWYATTVFDNTYLPDTSARSVSCKLNQFLP